MKRAQELLDEFSVQKLRQSHETIQRLTSQLQEMQEPMNSMNDSRELQEVESNHSGRSSYVPSQTAMILSSRSTLSRDKRLPCDTWNLSQPQGNVFSDQFSTFDSSKNHHQGIHHCETPRETGSVPVQLIQGLLSQEMTIELGAQFPMPTFARWSSTMSSLLPVENSQTSVVGQQRQQVSELQFDKFPTLSTFSIGGYALDQ